MTRQLKQNLQQAWTWEVQGAPQEVVFSDDKQEAYFFTDPVEDSTGSVGIRSSCPLRAGQHYWEVVFLEPLAGASVMVGLGTARAALRRPDFSDLLGCDEESWGLSYKGSLRHGGQSSDFCEPFFKPFTTIGCHLDMQRGTLTVYRNGEELGVAARGLHRVREPLYAMVSSCGAAEVRLGSRTYLAPSLLHRCCLTVLRETRPANLPSLPLPRAIKDFLSSSVEGVECS